MQFFFLLFSLFLVRMIHAMQNLSRPLMDVSIFLWDKGPDANGCASTALPSSARPIIILPPTFANIRRVVA
jgi:hypothetical protein